MENILVFGHKSPDTDTICSSIAMAELQKKIRNEEIIPCRLGDINEETRYALEYFKVETPKVIEKVEDGQVVIMVDHNEFGQSVDGIEDANIKMLVDHHRISNFQTNEPVFCFAEPVGSTGTILYKLYNMNNVEIDKKTASLMLSSIASDTLLFKSPTCTEEDKQVAKKLEEIAGVDIQTYGLEMLKAGTDLADVEEKDLINMDAKDFNVDNVKFTIAQVNTVSIPDIVKRQDKIEAAINDTIKDKNLDLFVFAITDILNGDSELLVLGDRKDIIEKNYKLEDNKSFAKGVVSRKKQILPLVTDNI